MSPRSSAADKVASACGPPGDAVGPPIIDAGVGKGAVARIPRGVGVREGLGVGAGWAHPAPARRAKRVKIRSRLKAFLLLKGTLTVICVVYVAFRGVGRASKLAVEEFRLPAWALESPVDGSIPGEGQGVSANPRFL